MPKFIRRGPFGREIKRISSDNPLRENREWSRKNVYGENEREKRDNRASRRDRFDEGENRRILLEQATDCELTHIDRRE